MELKVKDLVSSIDLNKSEVMLPIFESIINSIISLSKVSGTDKKIDIFLERETLLQEPDLYGKTQAKLKNVVIVDNGEGFVKSNYESFCMPYSPVNKQYGCKGIGRFTILAMFESVHVTSIFFEDGTYWKREFSFDCSNEIHNHTLIQLDGDHKCQTKVALLQCNNEELLSATTICADVIAKGIVDHCFIYYLCNNLPSINVVELSSDNNNNKSVNVSDYFQNESKDKEKDIDIKGESFHIYVLKSDKTTSRKNNYVTLCANSRAVGSKRNMADYDSLYTYPICENGESKFLDIYVVSNYLDSHINNSRTAFRIPEKSEDTLDYGEDFTVISIEDIMKAITCEASSMYASYAQATKERNIEEIKKYITQSAPQYRSFLYRQDILDSIPPNLTDDKKDEYLHKVAYSENKKITKKINEFIDSNEITEERIADIIQTIKDKTAYDTDSLVEYVFRRRAIIELFTKMMDAREDGKYELESMIHNLIFPMGLTNLQLSYQYHNLWLLDDRLASFRFIASDQSITSFSQIRSSHEPDIICIDNEDHLVNTRISFGDKDAGDIGMMVIFEFKRPGDTAYQKNKTNYRWEFSDLVEKYFDDFMFGKERKKKNYRGNVVNVNANTPKFGYVVMDEMPDLLVNYNKLNGWRETPYHSYYKIKPEQNMHIEAITFQNLLLNAKERNNPFFDHLFTLKI